jgi:hypothetical protein
MDMTGKALVTASKLAMAASLVLGGLAVGQEARAGGSKAGSKTDPSKKVCRSITRAGTRLATRLCLSQEEWDLAERKVQDGILDRQMHETTPATTGPFDPNPR